MANLYQIKNEILNCVDMETGEIIDFDRLAELQLERNAKIEKQQKGIPTVVIIDTTVGIFF